MNNSWKKEKRENLEAWVTTMDERLIDWFFVLGPDVKTIFDYSIKSLEDVEGFLIKNYTIDDIPIEAKRLELDGAVSYIGETIINSLNEAEWVIFPSITLALIDKERESFIL